MTEIKVGVEADKESVLYNTSVVSSNNGRLGYDYDPYDSPGEKVEGFFLGTIIGKLTGETDGFISTYREWHIFLQGMYAGFRAPTFGAVPECPPLWGDESQYFNSAAMVCNVIKCQWPTVVAVIGAIVFGTYTDIIPTNSIITTIMGLV
jgi:hypothetical protein